MPVRRVKKRTSREQLRGLLIELQMQADQLVQFTDQDTEIPIRSVVAMLHELVRLHAPSDWGPPSAKRKGRPGPRPTKGHRHARARIRGKLAGKTVEKIAEEQGITPRHLLADYAKYGREVARIDLLEKEKTTEKERISRIVSLLTARLADNNKQRDQARRLRTAPRPIDHPRKPPAAG
jgi:hypothetical protein